MSKEEIELLYKIFDLYIKEFNIRMIECQKHSDIQLRNECLNTIDKLEKEYKHKYGELPKWEYIDDVFKAREDLRMQLSRE